MARLTLLFLLLLTFNCCSSSNSEDVESSPRQAGDTRIVAYETQASDHLKMYTTGQSGDPFTNVGSLKAHLTKRGDSLQFAMNGGMFLKDLSPQGLYVENGIQLNPLDTIQEAYGNFYLQPNGIFYLTTDHIAGIQTTAAFKIAHPASIAFATQSGPMLVINGELHPAFNEGSPNVHIRNGVGLLPDGDLLFAISTEKINFYDFATFFKAAGCDNALYLDGFVSKMYCPGCGVEELDGYFGIIIAETHKTN